MKALRFIGYGIWFCASFIVGVYLTFPLDDMKGLIVDAAEEALGKGKQGPHGVDPRVQLGSLSLAGFGVHAERVSVQMASRDPDPGPTWEIDEVSVGIRPWSLLSDAKTVTFDADGYGGSADGVVSIDEKGALHGAQLNVDDLDLSKLLVVQEKLGVPLNGKLDIDAELDLGPTPEKDGSGDIKLELKNASIGQGNLKLAAAFGGFEIPNVDLGTLTAEIPVKQGKGTLTGVKLDGKDVQAELFGDITFRNKVQTSRLDVDGWFHLTPAFLEREKKFQSLLELGESMGSLGGGGMSLSKAKDDEGHYWFSVKGPLQNPLPALARDNGRRAKSKAQKGAAPAASPKEPKEPSTPESAG